LPYAVSDDPALRIQPNISTNRLLESDACNAIKNLLVFFSSQTQRNRKKAHRVKYGALHAAAGCI